MQKIQENVPLAPLTTFKVGGTARYYVQVTDTTSLMKAREFAEKNKLKEYIFGGGSNILFSDKGFSGIIIHMVGGGKEAENDRIYAGAGVPLGDVVSLAQERGLSGIERLAGVPGSFGGAVRGNAGAFGTEIGNIVEKVKAIDLKSGILREFSQSDCEFGYRTSIFKKYPHLLVLSADLRLKKGADPDALLATMRETLAKREAKHPQDIPSAGSFFVNPIVTDKSLHEIFERDSGMPSKNGRLPAGWLIDRVGLRGKQIGGAKISNQHPNYLINTGNATAEDIITLASIAKTRVRNEFSIQLKEEVQYVGF
ncbi:MAG: UDP-N-acetylenolpyruvoylglucosamine reductase [Candidatus Moranbacteria bacterium RIFCSPHIGHO2_01_FULL_55_24]|nr:MAG: UDP-N-acetylenolpyruvoylglucosamine reductase [Candidatus Moranbacteria bacterium RIFCSPHIGHO2_01_FULL_55_24]